jgi:hypothetical protein
MLVKVQLPGVVNFEWRGCGGEGEGTVWLCGWKELLARPLARLCGVFAVIMVGLRGAVLAALITILATSSRVRPAPQYW